MVEGKGEVSFEFTDEETEYSASKYIGFIFFSLLLAICLFGILVEYTSLFNRPTVENEEPAKDVADQKTTLGKAFVSFSFIRNARKLFWAPFNYKDNLRVLNGVRVLSMCYVVLGHSYINVFLVPTINISELSDMIQPLWFQLIPSELHQPV